MHEKHALPLPPQGAIDSGLSDASAGVGHGNRIGLQPRLRERGPCGKNRPPVNGRRGRIYFCKEVRACCRSSVVEHSLGKGEVDSSILSGSTSKINHLNYPLLEIQTCRKHQAGAAAPGDAGVSDVRFTTLKQTSQKRDS